MQKNTLPKTAIDDINRKISRQSEIISSKNSGNRGNLKVKGLAFFALAIGAWFVWQEAIEGDAPAILTVIAIGLSLAALTIPLSIAAQIYSESKDRKFAIAHLRNNLKTEVVNSFDAGYRYNPEPNFPTQLYGSCALFPSTQFDWCHAEDEICGVHEGLPFRVIEIHTQREIEDDKLSSDLDWATLVSFVASYMLDGIRNRRLGSFSSISSEMVDVYKGVVFVTEFKRRIQGVTIVREDILESRLGTVARSVQRLNNTVSNTISSSPGMELVEMENPEFEKYFSVETTDPIEARYILTPETMERLVDFRQKAGSGVNFCFQDSRLIVTKTGKADFLDQSIDIEKIRHSIYRVRKEIISFTEIINSLKLDDYKKMDNTINWKKAS